MTFAASGRPETGRSERGEPWSAALRFVAAALTHLGRDPLSAEEILTERGRLPMAGVDVHGDVSVGPAVSANRSCRLLRCADGLVAVNLPRPDDLELLPAWLSGELPSDANLEGTAVPWAAIASTVADRTSEAVVDAAQELGLAVAKVPESAAGHVDVQLVARGTFDASRPFVRTSVGGSGTDRTMSGVRVVDLSSLWAGPLCSRLLAEAGADVIKVESTTRPDGTRFGDPELFERLHSGKRFAKVPFGPGESGAALRELIAEADVVIEGSRPRALDRLGIDPLALLAERPGKVWLSITAHGRTGPWRNRVGFGDDAAAAAGLLDSNSAGEPRFVGDAIADPLTGVLGATLITDAVAHGGGVMIDLALREVARSVALGAQVAW
jgi:crotonobetainyl-CoA:carnitine CoA-transferase CaiB-like acyl-CoA transferase